MSSSWHLVCGVAILSILSGADGYYEHYRIECHFSSSLNYLEYVGSNWFDKIKNYEFNSTVGKFVGYTENGVYNAEEWNKGSAFLAQLQAEKERYCRPNVQTDIDSILTKTVPPEVRLSLVRASSGDQPAVLMCSAYSFYPKMIRVKWYRDEQEVTGDVTSTEELMNGDWYYQIHSHLQFTPKAGEKISCVVEHASLKEPKEITWDSSVPEAERNKVAIGAAALVLGLVVCAAGLLYYRKKSQGWILVPPR